MFQIYRGGQFYFVEETGENHGFAVVTDKLYRIMLYRVHDNGVWLYVNLCYVLQADEAYHIGPPTASQSYLCQDKIINIAKLSGAKVIYFLWRKVLKWTSWGNKKA